MMGLGVNQEADWSMWVWGWYKCFAFLRRVENENIFYIKKWFLSISQLGRLMVES